MCVGSCVKISLQVAAYGYLPWINFSDGEKEMQSQHSGSKNIFNDIYQRKLNIHPKILLNIL